MPFCVKLCCLYGRQIDFDEVTVGRVLASGHSNGRRSRPANRVPFYRALDDGQEIRIERTIVHTLGLL